MTVMSTQTYANLLEPIARINFYMGRDSVVRSHFVSNLIMEDKPSHKLTETLLNMGDIGELQPFSGSSVHYDSYKEGYKTEVTAQQYTAGLKIERKFLDTNQYPQFTGSMSVKMGMTYARSKENRKMSFIRNAFNTSVFTYGDSLSLCNGSHKNPNDSTTQSNKGTTALSRTQLGVIRYTMRRFKNHRGQPAGVIANLVIVPPELEDLAEELTKSETAPDSNTGAINVNRRMSYAVSDYLDDPNDYFVFDSTLARMSFSCFNVVEDDYGQSEDFDSMAIKYRASTFFGVGTDDWLPIYGSQVS